MKLFLGEFDHVLDDRGRVTLPRKIRQVLEYGDVVLSKGFDGCIFGFDPESWQKEAGKHLESPVTDKSGRELRRYLFSAADNVQADKLGRIILPTHLKEYAGITGKVKFIGAGDHFEIWDTDTWAKYPKDLRTP
ncbi:division/cell wall cluster transcriptional repressor MraZ [Candidatus Gottesmanbacteria bacterium RBG_16_52_11]|uniref:Transcriptional regulator MraZ n=1 Tax=Candidatus Gottesmanbacteria bacterium RBG_16_52_11 TaxID=1798374 RepID=A0A1F5YUN5_9BACT|nr:MAG: division/cell wall cluster transcriptional repressor MraZ [Candidatus Gottesmanbacteria bacterium RBG_16_52_11]